MQFSEIYFIWNTYGVYPHKHDFVIGTYFLGVGVSLVALSSHPILNKIKLGVLGKYTLGMYVVHFIFVDIFKPLDEKLFNPFWDFGFIVIVLLLSLGTIILLSKNKYTKRIVL